MQQHLLQLKAKNWSTVIEYAESIRDGKKVACLELKQAVDRFFRDLDNPEYEVNPKAPEFCIQIIEKTIKHQQGERIDGTPLRGTPFLLEPFHKFIIYNLVGFYHKGTGIVRFHEALIFIPRKNIKTSFAAALAWALSLWYRDKLGASPMEGLDELVLLENYIPLDKIGDQKKLIQEGDTDGN